MRGAIRRSLALLHETQMRDCYSPAVITAASLLMWPRRFHTTPSLEQHPPSPSDTATPPRTVSLLQSEKTLAEVCRAEIHQEELRDALEGVPAIAPMVPPGWVMEPRGSASNFFVLTRRRATSNSSLEDGHMLTSHRVFRSKQEEEIEAIHRDLAPRTTTPSSSSSLRNARASSPARSTTNDDDCVQIFCPMRTLDPSLHDASVDLCEWTVFDVIVRKPLQRTADVLYVSLASANSELRVRSVQVLSPQHICSTATAPDNSAPPSPLAIAAAMESASSFGVAGEFYRQTQLFPGPLMSDMPKAFQESLLDYLHSCLGVTPEVREFLCQMLYVLEQESYTAWLAQLGHFSSKRHR